MHVKRFLFAGAFALAAAAAGPAAVAAPCAGFTDVDDSSGFCPNVEWLKNRSITLGCTSATTYCPTDAVTRLSMAAFMNRLGTALTPITIRKRVAAGAQNFSTLRTLCATDVPDGAPAGPGFTVTGFPRKAIVTALLNAFTLDTGGMNLEASVVYSIDNGATWVLSPRGDGFAFGSLYANLTPPDDISLRAHTVIDLAVGQTYQFAVQGRRTSSTGGGANANAYCEVHVEVVNRNSTTSPLDEAPPLGPRGRGD